MGTSLYPIFSHFLLSLILSHPLSLSVTPTHTLQTLCCGWTWAVFPDVIKCGFSWATLPHFTPLQLLLQPSPVITTYQPLGATSTPAETGSRICIRIQLTRQSSPLRNKPETSRVSNMNWERGLINMNWQHQRTDASLPALSSREFGSQMLREFWADILKRDCPFSKMVDS